MASSDQASYLAAVFLHRKIIGDIVNEEISEQITSGRLACSHCSDSFSQLGLPWLPEQSNVFVPTTPTAFEGQLQIFDRQLSEQATRLRQFTDNPFHNRANRSSQTNNSIAANLSTSANLVHKLANVEQRLTDLEYCIKQVESSVAQSGSENVDTTILLEKMHANFETTMSKLQSALKQAISNQPQSTDRNKPSPIGGRPSSSNLKLKKCVTDLVERILCVELNNEQLQVDVDNVKVLHSVAVDKHEVLSALVSNIGHEHAELAEFVRQLSQRTASADDVIELKTIVECMARVIGESEHKAEQMITDLIGKEGVELEHLKRAQRLAEDNIHKLQLARDEIANMPNSAYHNQLPFLSVIAETMQRECERYKHDLNATAKRLRKRLNAMVAQAIQLSLVEQHKKTCAAQVGVPPSPTKSQDTKPREPINIRHNSGEVVTEPLSRQQSTTTLQQLQLHHATMPRHSQSDFIYCTIVGHESAQTRKLIRAYTKEMSGRSVKCAGDDVIAVVRIPLTDGTVYKLHVASYTEASKLRSMHFCNIIVICYSVINKVSYEDVRNVWLKQIKNVFPDRRYLLVGTHIDKRRKTSKNKFQVDYNTGSQLSQDIGAVAYFECSGLDMGRVKNMFMQTLQHAIGNTTT
jgi:hypothetical protein